MQDDSQSTEDHNGPSKKDAMQAESDTSDSDDDWNAKSGKAKKKKIPNKRNKRKVTKSSSEDSASDDEPTKVSEPEEGITNYFHKFCNIFLLNCMF